ncbi:MAG: family 16 glycosylhydrolase [Flavobacteriales bacterium]|nr:family 16 glycosylhydrolase [Flavobacteriales bacterium]
MRVFSIILFLIYFSTNSLFSQSWNLIWNDEFSFNHLDSTKWIHDIGTGSQYGLYGWGNSELQYYQPSNTEVYNGTAKIIAKVEPNGIVDSWGNTMYYSSSKITTKGIFDFKYGKVEAKIKTIDGQGFWPAFWMLPSGGSWPCNGEIDIMEQWGSDGPTNTTTGAAHVGICPGSSFYQSFSNVISSGSYADNFHVYSVQWQPDYIAWYVDNVQFFQVTPSSYPSNYTWPFNSNDWYLMINLAISNSTWAPAPNSNTIFPSQIEIDYVRVYEQNGILGCTDSTANNYDVNATIDNGSCEYIVSFSVDLNCSTNLNPPSVVYVTSSAINWDCNTYALNDSNSDGIWTGDIILQNGFFEYIYCTDGWSNSESSGLITSMQNGGTCATNTDYSTYANRLINIFSDTIISNVWGSCGQCVSGCTDPTATNYNSNAGYDDGSCIYNSNFNITFQLDMNNITSSFTIPEVNGTFNGWCGSCWPMSDADGDNIWNYTTSIPSGLYEYKYAADGWNIAENLTMGSFCTLTTGIYTNRLINVTSDTILPVVCWESCSLCPTSTCGAITGVNMSDVIHDRAWFNWDDMNSSTCDVDQIRFRYREVGTNAWSTKTMGAPVGNSALCLNTSKRVINLTTSTQYEYDFKIWYQDGTVVSWHSGGTFTTADPCLNATNVTASPNSGTQTDFCWDAPAAPWSFVRLKYRVDTGGAWANIGGMGVMSPLLCKTKNGLTPSQTYRAIWRTFCNPTGGPYRSPVWDGPITWTQPSGVRVEGGTTITNLDVYPNPSRDIFNVRFTSEDVQDLDVRIINVIGEVVYTEDLNEIVGEYTKQVNLSTYTKGVYFLEITTDNGVINKKIVLC